MRDEDRRNRRGLTGLFRLGEWDLVAIIEVTDYEGVASVVTEHMTQVPGLKSTQTLTAFRAYSKKDLEQAWDIGLE
jgi:DNA-binding Lrp family transcriptional regulator